LTASVTARAGAKAGHSDPVPGWIAQWKEMIEDPNTKIGRPRQIYIGATERPYVPIDQR